jgi:hypothetical protein
MRSSRRLALLLMPWTLWAGRSAHAQPNSSTAAGGSPGREQTAEVQAGAGTLGDVTTGSSGKRRGGGEPPPADTRRSDAAGTRGDAAGASRRGDPARERAGRSDAR